MLTRKTSRQSAFTSSPPSGGPAAAAMPPLAAQIPIATWRFSGSNSGSISPSEVGSISAPPTAWTTRAATSTPTDGAAAQAGAREHEHAEAEQEGALAPERVGPAAGWDEQRREHDRVGAQHPRERG